LLRVATLLIILLYRKDIIMNKTELIAAVAAAAGVSKKDAAAVIDATVDTISNAVAAGDKVQLIGFGTFAVRENAARSGINPRTGATVEIAASKTPVFKAGAAFKAKVN
jgi:DNA-binding protein HU-beta